MNSKPRCLPFPPRSEPTARRRWRGVIALSLALSIGSGSVLSAQGFRTGQVVTGQTNEARCVAAADIDGDGDLDAVAGSNDYREGKVSWFENRAGQQGFGPVQVIADDIETVLCVVTGDLDGDGDVDVLAVGPWSYSSDGYLVWFENTNGKGTFGGARAISSVGDEPETARVADLDGDGDLDVVMGSFRAAAVAWYENVDGQGNFGPLTVLVAGTSGHCIEVKDLDGDGDLDVITREGSSSIAWVENLDGLAHFSAPIVVTTTLDSPRSVSAADLDGDGDEDLLAASYDDVISWFENADGTGTFGPQRIISREARGARSARAADVDGDGDRDVIAALPGDREIAWFENTDGQGTFGARHVLHRTRAYPYWLVPADLDGDSDLDVLAACAAGTIQWHENTDALGTYRLQQRMTLSAWHPLSLCAADFDGDGDADLLASSSDGHRLSWLENRTWPDDLQRRGYFGIQHVLPASSPIQSHAGAADLDGDGDEDIFSVSPWTHTIAWYENLVPAGTFGPETIITITADGVSRIDSADLDGDGDLDLVACGNDGTYANHWWFENSNGLGAFGPARLITQIQSSLPSDVLAADLDGDGDPDCISTARMGWNENLDGLGTFGPFRDIGATQPAHGRACAADLDGDGDVDLLASRISTSAIVWYENTDGSGTFSGARTISTTTDTHPPTEVAAIDLDGDGDLDVVAAAFRELRWWENRDGLGTFGPHAELVVFSTVGSSRALDAADFDGDGDQDLVWSSSAPYSHGAITWSENGPFPTATCAWYCGAGTNLDTYTISTGVQLGGTFEATVDFPSPNVGAAIAGYLGVQYKPLWGQLLLVDIRTPEVMGMPASFGTSPVTITWSVPLFSSYAGFHVFTQAAGIGGGQINLTCAYDCEVGF